MTSVYCCLAITGMQQDVVRVECIVGSPIVGQMFFRATLFTSYYQVKAESCRLSLQYITTK